MSSFLSQPLALPTYLTLILVQVREC